MKTIQIIHGPNLNLLGSREPEQYGTVTLISINQQLSALAEELGCRLTIFQSNAEHQLIDTIQQTTADFLIINPAALTHTSIALRDALLAVRKPFIEVHLSNIYSREPFRQLSYFSDIAVGVISGLGHEGYLMALRYAFSHTTQKRSIGHHGHAKNPETY
jgi:3-dehydroquinate dehydratase-2